MNGFKVLERVAKDWYVSPKMKDQDAVTRYDIGKETFPRLGCGPLCVFEDKASACAFLKDLYKWSFYDPQLELAECTYEPALDFEHVWFPLSDMIPSVALLRGTVLAQCVTITRLL